MYLWKSRRSMSENSCRLSTPAQGTHHQCPPSPCEEVTAAGCTILPLPGLSHWGTTCTCPPTWTLGSDEPGFCHIRPYRKTWGSSLPQFKAGFGPPKEGAQPLLGPELSDQGKLEPYGQVPQGLPLALQPDSKARGGYLLVLQRVKKEQSVLGSIQGLPRC